MRWEDRGVDIAVQSEFSELTEHMITFPLQEEALFKMLMRMMMKKA